MAASAVELNLLLLLLVEFFTPPINNLTLKMEEPNPPKTRGSASLIVKYYSHPWERNRFPFAQLHPSLPPPASFAEQRAESARLILRYALSRSEIPRFARRDDIFIWRNGG